MRNASRQWGFEPGWGARFWLVLFGGRFHEVAEAFPLCDCVIGIRFRVAGFRWPGGNPQARLPSFIGIRKFRRLGIAIERGHRFGKTSLLIRLRLGNDFVFELGQSRQQFTRLEGLYHKSIGPGASRLLGLKRLKFADGQKHWDARRLAILLDALTHLEPAVPGHIHIQDDQVGLVFDDLLKRS